MLPAGVSLLIVFGGHKQAASSVQCMTRVFVYLTQRDGAARCWALFWSPRDPRHSPQRGGGGGEKEGGEEWGGGPRMPQTHMGRGAEPTCRWVLSAYFESTTGFSLLSVLSVSQEKFWRSKSYLRWSAGCNAALPHTCCLSFPLCALNLYIFRILFPLCFGTGENTSLGCPSTQLFLLSSTEPAN